MPDAPPQTIAFLSALFGARPPDGTRIALWAKPTKTSIYIDLPEQAAVQEGQTDVYVSAGLAPAEMSESRRRIKARECSGIPGVWIDVDVNGGPDEKTGVAPDRDTAAALARVELEPTMLVDSGYGLQAWWLFDDPWVFGGDAERSRAARITEGWEVLHRNHARRHGHGLDSVHDLARLMRLPGTVNGKGGLQAPVTALELDGPRYAMERIAEISLSVAPVGDTAVTVDPDASFPLAKFEGLMENHDFFRKTWEHRRKDREAEGWSLSEYDMALASIAASTGWTNDEIAALLREHREKQGSPLKGRRQDYVQRTISRARNQLNRTEQQRARERAVDDVRRAEERGELTDDMLYSKLNQAWGAGTAGRVPPVKELVQYSDDPDEARYVLVFADGQEANVGQYRSLRNIRLLDERLGPVIGVAIPRLKDEEWRDLLNALLRFRTVREEPEPQILAWIRHYLGERLSTDRDEAATAGEPFKDNGHVYLRAEGLARFAKVALKERVRTADLWALLRKAGFETTQIHHLKRAGEGETTSTYWRAAQADINLG